MSALLVMVFLGFPSHAPLPIPVASMEACEKAAQNMRADMRAAAGGNVLANQRHIVVFCLEQTANQTQPPTEVK